MKIRRTNAFSKDYDRLPEEIRKRVAKQLEFLITNPKHPSLRLKKLQGTPLWEMRISQGYRLTLHFEESMIVLRRVGTHDILRKISASNFS